MSIGTWQKSLITTFDDTDIPPFTISADGDDDRLTFHLTWVLPDNLRDSLRSLEDMGALYLYNKEVLKYIDSQPWTRGWHIKPNWHAGRIIFSAYWLDIELAQMLDIDITEKSVRENIDTIVEKFNTFLTDFSYAIPDFEFFLLQLAESVTV